METKSTLTIEELLGNYDEIIDEELKAISIRKELLDVREKRFMKIKEEGLRPKLMKKDISNEEWDNLPNEAKFYDYIMKFHDVIKATYNDEYNYQINKISNDYGYTRIGCIIVIRSSNHPAYIELDEKGSSVFGPYFKDIVIRKRKDTNTDRYTMIIEFIQINKYDEIIWRDWNGNDSYSDALNKVIDYINSFNK